MTDDVSRGLALLAAEAEPAPIDSYALISRARTRTRNRRSMAAAFVAVVAVGAIAVAVGPLSSGGDTPAERLTGQLAAALPGVIPDRWEPAEPPETTQSLPRTFRCTEHPPLNRLPVGADSTFAGTMCFADAYYQDSQGTIRIGFSITISDQETTFVCLPGCHERILPDGTWAQVSPDGVKTVPADRVQMLLATRPDNTTVNIILSWHNQRTTTPLTDDELLKLATVFSR